MTNDEILKDIIIRHMTVFSVAGILAADKVWGHYTKDVGWLINRVKRLTEALEHYADASQYEDRGLGVTNESIARKALEDE